jgi:hypothetical protein
VKKAMSCVAAEAEDAGNVKAEEEAEYKNVESVQ